MPTASASNRRGKITLKIRRIDTNAADFLVHLRALAAAKKALTQETITFIKETFGDLDSYLKPMIEAQVRSQKTYM